MAALAEQRLFGISQTALRWNVSKDTVRRAAESGELRTVNILGRVLVPLEEIVRVENEGLGSSRKLRARQEKSDPATRRGR
jgi:hypothetical protein